jgi:hypothetical protein
MYIYILFSHACRRVVCDTLSVLSPADLVPARLISCYCTVMAMLVAIGDTSVANTDLSQFSELFPTVAGDASTKVAYATPDAFAYTYVFGLLCRHVNLLKSWGRGYAYSPKKHKHKFKINITNQIGSPGNAIFYVGAQFVCIFCIKRHISQKLREWEFRPFVGMFGFVFYGSGNNLFRCYNCTVNFESYFGAAAWGTTNAQVVFTYSKLLFFKICVSGSGDDPAWPCPRAKTSKKHGTGRAQKTRT